MAQINIGHRWHLAREMHQSSCLDAWIVICGITDRASSPASRRVRLERKQNNDTIMTLARTIQNALRSQRIVLPSALGMELILLGGMRPTSVTTAVIEDEGVKSNRGSKISKLGTPDPGVFATCRGAINRCKDNRKLRCGQDKPSSFFPKPSSMIFSLNLYVSQHAITGTLYSFAIIATIAVPALE